ncbi:MAG: hypothetical protein ACTSYI_04700 [Promethearchaeota archaeon]
MSKTSKKFKILVGISIFLLISIINQAMVVGKSPLAVFSDIEVENFQGEATDALEITFTWDEVDDPDFPISNSGENVYQIYYGLSEESMEQFSYLSPTLTSMPFTQSDSFESFVAGETYFFKIRVATSSFERVDDEYGVWSDIINATAIDDPSTPLNFAVTGKSNGIELTWDTPADLGGSDILQYSIYRSEADFLFYSGDDVSKITSVGNTTLSYLDTTATSGVTYFYMVVPETIIGNGVQTDALSGAVDADADSGDPADDDPSNDDSADDDPADDDPGDSDGGIPGYSVMSFIGIVVIASLLLKSKYKC